MKVRGFEIGGVFESTLTSLLSLASESCPFARAALQLPTTGKTILNSRA